MRVRVVEDAPQIAAFIQRGLEEEPYAVAVVRGGGTAVACASVTPDDLLVLDRLLPRRAGLSGCGELRRRGDCDEAARLVTP